MRAIRSLQLVKVRAHRRRFWRWIWRCVRGATQTCHVYSPSAIQRGSIPCTALWAASCKEKCVGSGFPLEREVLSASKDPRPDKSKGCQITPNFRILMWKYQDKCLERSNRNCCMQRHIRERLSLYYPWHITSFTPCFPFPYQSLSCF